VAQSGSDWNSGGGVNSFAMVRNAAINLVDILGLKKIMKCTRCWKTDCVGTRTGKWSLTCVIEDDGDSGFLCVGQCNDYSADQKGNSDSITPGDPYGRNGPLEPGGYTVTNRDMGRFRNGGGSYFRGNDGKTPVVSNNDKGGVTTSRGTERSGIMVHPQRNLSNGCITCSAEFAQTVEDSIEENGGSLTLEIVDGGDC
jgi:hypothetical protein